MFVGYLHLVREIRFHDHEFFCNMFRMTPYQLEELSTWVAQFIVKDSVHREANCPEERFCLTQRYLANGNSPVRLAVRFMLGETTVWRIIPETCDALWDVLIREGFMNVPRSPDEWDIVASEMERRWNFQIFLLPCMANMLLWLHLHDVAPYILTIKTCSTVLLSLQYVI